MKILNLSSYFSLIVQLVSGIVGVNGLFIKLKPQDEILKTALKLETLVQLIEFIFYIYLIYTIQMSKLTFNITSVRYFDWMITTPTMLISTIMFLQNEKKEDFNFKKELNTIIKITVGNWLMLLFGYLGEINILNLGISNSFGFIFFAYTFKQLYSNYVKTKTGIYLYYFMFIIWSLYGVASVLSFETKNIMYNILDLFSKNFYGIFLYYIIKKKSINNNE